jgi:hypothetical protein
VTSYEIRLRANDEMTADTFDDALEVKAMVTPGGSGDCGVQGGFPPAGSTQSFDLDGLLPETDYWVGVRAFDKCHNAGDLAIFKFTTPEQRAGEVDACFIATAAYGSAMANDVDMLRRFRDYALRSSALGEVAIEAYYTFGPALAGVAGQSQLLRASARSVLSPLVRRVRPLAY